MGVKKSIRKLISLPMQMRLKEVANILQYCGYRLKRIRGSHYHFTRPAKRVITIAVHNKKVNGIYLIFVKDLILEFLNKSHEK